MTVNRKDGNMCDGNFTKIKYHPIITIDITISFLIIFRKLNGRKINFGFKGQPSQKSFCYFN